MAKSKVTSVTPGKGGVKHVIKKPIAKTSENLKSKSKKHVVKALGKQLLSSGKPEIVSTAAPVVGMEVQVKWVDNTTYTAKVVQTEDGKCLVHYKGWNSKHDEWVIMKATGKRKAFAELSNISIKQKNNMKTLKAIKSIKKGVDVSEGLIDSDNSDKDIDENDPEMAGLCEYEKIRLRNIRERQAMFAELQISEAKSDFSQLFTPTQNRQAPSKRGLASEKKEKVILPPRKSSRLSGGKVPEIDRFVPLLEAPAEENSVPLESISIEESFNKSDDPVSLSHTQNFLTSLSKATTSKSTVSFNSSFSFKSSISSLSIKEELVAKVVPGRIFALAIHPSSTPLVAAVGDKSGHVGLWDILATSSPNHGVHLYHPHTRPVNCISWDLANTNNLVSTSYDGTVRLLDTEKQEHTMLYGEKEFLDWGGWISSHAQMSTDTFLISQGTNGKVVLVDRRVSWTSPVTIFNVFDRLHPKTLSVHPVHNNLFLTCNNKGGCYIFDARNTTNSTTKLLEPVSELLGHTKSLSCCYFSPVTGNQVITMSTDDKLRLFNTTTTSKTISPQCQVKHNNQTGRWLTPFRASWHPTREGMLVTGSMERPRQIEVWGSSSGSLDMVGKLRGEELGSVCSLVGIHDSREVVVGGNSSGRVHVFM
eukprot:TRINITY_DN11976_c0_g1_i1.p1 TRINITY_DN11976_c0_g1~~TRINITY_DN11976_c0_g1_i1.p1  ORF type:complete len:647 (-),score=230.67 TRINITY_DN11976_c0_g1_i1:29-1969(-)